MESRVLAGIDTVSLNWNGGKELRASVIPVIGVRLWLKMGLIRTI